MTQYAIQVRPRGLAHYRYVGNGGKLVTDPGTALRFYERETAATIIKTSKAANPGSTWRIMVAG